MAKLTKNIVERAATNGKPYFIFDDQLPGFCARIAPNGKRHYYVQYMLSKQTKRLPLGLHGIITAEKAREKAIIALAQVKEGRDPQAERTEKLHEATVRDLAERYYEEHAKIHCKPGTCAGYRRNLDIYILPELGSKKVSEVDRKDIANFHHGLRHAPYDANRCLEMISKMFNLAELWGLRDDGTNPRRHIEKFKENKRERYLSAEETRRLGETLRMVEEASLCSSYAVAAFRLLVLTGARLGEIQFCKWEYVHLDRGIIRLPDSKTGPKLIHLGRSAIDLLRDLPRREGNSYVICSDHKPDEPINDLQTTWQKIRKWAGIEDVRIHDLRHTFASNAVAMGMSLPMIGRLLGHTQTQTTARYAHLALDPVLEAASKVTGELGSLMALPPPRDPLVIDMEAKSIEPAQLPPLAGKLALADLGDRPRFMTSDQAAEYLGVRPRLMENWRWRKCGPNFVKVGNSVRYTREDLDSFVMTSSQKNEHVAPVSMQAL